MEVIIQPVSHPSNSPPVKPYLSNSAATILGGTVCETFVHILPPASRLLMETLGGLAVLSALRGLHEEMVLHYCATDEVWCAWVNTPMPVKAFLFTEETSQVYMETAPALDN